MTYGLHWVFGWPPVLSQMYQEKQKKGKKKCFSKMRFGIILTGLVSSAMGIWEFQNHAELASETRLFPGTIDTEKVLIPDKSCACCVNFYFTYL